MTKKYARADGQTQITFQLEAALKEALKKEAKLRKRSMSNLIVIAIEEYLSNDSVDAPVPVLTVKRGASNPRQA